MMFKLLLLLPIIFGSKCLVYSNDNNDTSTTSTVDTQSAVTSLLTQTPGSLAADGAGQTPENPAEQTGAEATEVVAHQDPEGTTQQADEASGTVVVEESEKPAEEAAQTPADQGSGTGAFQVVVVGSPADSAAPSSEGVDQSAGETVVEEGDGTVVGEPANEVAVVTAETAAQSLVEDQTAGDQVVAEEVVQVAQEENVSAETTELVAEDTVVTESVVVEENVVSEAVTEVVAEPVVAEEPVPEVVLPEVNGIKLVDLDIVNFENNNHVNHTFDRKLNMHMFSVRSGHAFGSVKESFSKHELEYLAKEPLYMSLRDLKNIGQFHLHTDNIVNGAYRWKDTLVLLEHLKNGTLESKLQEETLFVTVEVDKMEVTRHVNYGFVDNLHVFAANSPFIIDSVKLDGEFVWVYDDDRNDKKFPVSVEFNGSDMIKLKFQKFYLTYTKNGSKKWNVQFDFYEQPAIEGPKEPEAEAEQVTATTKGEHVAESNQTMAQDQVAEGDDMAGVSVAEEPAKEGEQVAEQQADAQEVAPEEPANEEAPMAEDTVASPVAETDQHTVEDTTAVPVAEVETVAVPESEPELLLDDHLVSALEFIWKQNPEALDVKEPAKPVYADYVYVKTTGNEKTVTIFFTDRSIRRFYRVGPLGPWRERVDRPRPITLPPYPRIQYKPLELWTFPEPRQDFGYEFTKGVALSDRSSQKPTDRRDAKPYGRDFLAVMYSQTKKPDGQGTSAQRGGQESKETSPPAQQKAGKSCSGDQDSDGSGHGSSGMTSGGSSGGDQDGSTVPTTPDPNQSSTATPASETDTSAPSAEPEVVAKEAITLDIKNDKKATTQFEYKKEGKKVTYTAKSGFGFSSVKSKSGGSCCGKKDVKIWDAKDPKDYASKVVLEGKGNKKKTVTIHFDNGTKKEFKKDDKTWNEIPQAPVNTGTTPTSAASKAEGAHLTGQSAGGDGTTGTGQPASRKNSTASNSSAANGGSTSRKNSTASTS